jgi:hypothetical protein
MKKVEKFKGGMDRFKVRRPKVGDVGHKADLFIISFSNQERRMNYKYQGSMLTAAVTQFTIYGARAKDV